MVQYSLMVLSEVVSIGCIVTLSVVPDIIFMVLVKRILFDSEISISSKEVAIEGTRLDARALLVDV